VKNGIESILKDISFTEPSQTARNVLNIAKDMKKWIAQQWRSQTQASNGNAQASSHIALPSAAQSNKRCELNPLL